jgi:hypothetical protein
MEYILRVTVVISPSVGLSDFFPASLGGVANYDPLPFDERSGLHLNFLDLPVVDESRSVGLVCQPLKIEVRIHADINLSAHPIAQPLVDRWLPLVEENRTNINRPPVIGHMDDSAQRFITRWLGVD